MSLKIYKASYMTIVSCRYKSSDFSEKDLVMFFNVQYYSADVVQGACYNMLLVSLF